MPPMQAAWSASQADCGVKPANSALYSAASRLLAAKVSGDTVAVPVGTLKTAVGTSSLGVPVGVTVADGANDNDDDNDDSDDSDDNDDKDVEIVVNDPVEALAAAGDEGADGVWEEEVPLVEEAADANVAAADNDADDTVLNKTVDGADPPETCPVVSRNGDGVT